MEEKDSVCVWQECKDDKRVFLQTDCGWHPGPGTRNLNYCPACGRRINILREPKKEGEE